MQLIKNYAGTCIISTYTLIHFEVHTFCICIVIGGGSDVMFSGLIHGFVRS